jgi:hypothetical protein
VNEISVWHYKEEISLSYAFLKHGSMEGSCFN